MNAADILFYVRIAGDIYFGFACMWFLLTAALYHAGEARAVEVKRPLAALLCVLWWGVLTAAWFVWAHPAMNAAIAT